MEPLTLALLGGASTLGSMFFNGQAQDQVDAARNGVIQKNRVDQAALDAEAKGVTDQSLGRFKDFGTQQATDAARLSDYFKTAVTTPNTPLTAAPLPPSTSDIVNREIQTKGDIAKAYVGHQADTLGRLRSFGDLMGNISRSQAQDTQHIGQLGSFKAGDTGVTNIALDNANRAGNTNAALGNLFAGLGKVGLTAGLSGTLAPAAAAVAPGAPMNILPPGNIFSSGASPFLTYGANYAG